MGMSKRQLLSNMDSRELTDWMIYEEIEPFGSFASTRNMAVLVALVKNMMSKKPISWEEVYPELRKERDFWLEKSTKNVDQSKLSDKIIQVFSKLAKGKSK